MLEIYFVAPKTLARLRAGPSGPYLDGFAASLERDGYRGATAVRYLRAAAHLGHFLQGQGGALTDVDLSAFFVHLQTCRCSRSKGGSQGAPRAAQRGRYGRSEGLWPAIVRVGVPRPARARRRRDQPSASGSASGGNDEGRQGQPDDARISKHL
jgi:hypothetical protein